MSNRAHRKGLPKVTLVLGAAKNPGDARHIFEGNRPLAGVRSAMPSGILPPPERGGMRVNIKKKVRAVGEASYHPWPELNHAARVLRRAAREQGASKLHVVTGAVVLTAFAVEAFCQTLGPDLFPDRWASGAKPLVEKAVLRKLELIGHEVGVDVDYNQEPWIHVSALFEAKRQLLTPSSSPVPLDEDVSVDEDADPRFDVHAAVQRHFRPLHNLVQLEKVAAEVNKGLLNIWDAAGGAEAVLDVLGHTSWAIQSAE